MTARGERSLYRRVFARLWSAAPAATVAFVVAVVVVPVTGALFVLCIGSLVGRLPGALGASGAAQGWDRLRQPLVLGAAVLLVQQVAFGVAQGLASTLGRRLEGSLRHQVMAAALAPDGVAHLADVAVRDRIAEATPLGSARFGVGWAVESMVPMLTSLLTGVAMAVVVTAHVWWLGPILGGAWFVARRHRLRDNVAQSALIGTESFGTRRQSYFRRLGLTPAAAKELRVFGLSDWLVHQFHAQWAATVEQVWRARRERRPGLLVPFGVLAAGNLVAFVFVARAASTGDIDLRTMTILVQAALGVAIMAEPGGTVLADSSFVNGLATMHTADALEDAVGRLDAVAPRPEPVPVRTAVTLRDVAFHYPGSSRDVLRGLTLDIPAGRSLAIVGANGAGKTTLVRLLSGLLAPTAGEIAVDGVRLDELSPAAWRAGLGVVMQDFTRFPFTVAENVLLGERSTVDPWILERVAGDAGLASVVADLPDGWDTVLTREVAGGVDLSGGEWQRVALARALMAVQRGASVLLLDEPTANLDVRAEAAFYDRFLDVTRGTTTVLISHRFATVRRADVIAVLDSGRIAELGSHEELMACGGRYAELFTLQAASFDAPEAVA